MKLPVSQLPMKRFWWVAFFFGPVLAAWGAAPAGVATEPGTVVLLHGIGLRSWTLCRLERALERDGYRVVNLTYPSRTMPIEKIGREWLPAKMRERGVGEGPLYFVSHSMGGIVIRMWLRECGVPANLRRVVMLAPPNLGSAVADRMKNFAPYRWFLGENGLRLGTGENSVPRSLGPWPAGAAELGVIAGDYSINPLFSAWLREPNDGAVAVANTRLEGMSDFLVLHRSHTMLPWRGETLKQVSAFLRHGHFTATTRP
ncbi:MAG TPA: alpha/beta fold hydrolase [Opitutaceae bacterium]|nr:alpha/beta fold hydrolase [Opitutaceae bacterium]